MKKIWVHVECRSCRKAEKIEGVMKQNSEICRIKPCECGSREGKALVGFSVGADGKPDWKTFSRLADDME